MEKKNNKHQIICKYSSNSNKVKIYFENLR